MNWTPSLIIRALLSATMLTGYFALVYSFIVGDVKYGAEVREPIIMMIQAIGVGVGMMLQYWFGTSQSGAEKSASDNARMPGPVQTTAQSATQSTTTSTTPPPKKPE